MFARVAYLMAVAIFLIAASDSAKAAPQVLAVLSSNSGIPFICDSGECRAELSTYCLQRDRDTPKMGAAYKPAHTADFTLTVTDSRGVRRQLSAANIAFVGHRGYMSATAVIPAEIVERLDVASATIAVGGNASLVPVPVVGDDNPLTAKEIEAATGKMRRFGAQIVDNSVKAAAAQVLARVSERFSPVENFRPVQMSSLWREAITTVQDDLQHPDGVRRARVSFDKCIAISRDPSSFSGDEYLTTDTAIGFASLMLRCLQRTHDDTIRDVNKDYWNGLAGS